jgi:hypothetical protein
MRCLSRNKVRFFYALYESRELVEDEYGNVTGDYDVIHGDPIEGYANISAAKGETQTRQFGENEAYDKVIVTDNDGPPIDEYSVLWVDALPLLDGEGKTETPYDYVVVRRAASLNQVSFAIRKVNVSYG